LTVIRFSIWNNNAVPVWIRPRVRIHLMDGAGGGPGTYYTGWSGAPFQAAANTWYNYGFGVSAVLPNANIWVGETFDNSAHPETTDAMLNNFGQMMFDPPAVGSSTDVMFRTTAASVGNVGNPSGSLFNFSGTPKANLFYSLYATPEPSSIIAIAAGLAGLLGLRRRK